jgi:hypothetical protein
MGIRDSISAGQAIKTENPHTGLNQPRQPADALGVTYREECSNMTGLLSHRARRYRALFIAGVGLVAWVGGIPATADAPHQGLLPEVRGTQQVRADEEAFRFQLPGGVIPPHEAGYLAPAVVLLGLSGALRLLTRRPAV